MRALRGGGPQGWGPSGVGHGIWALRGGAGGGAVCLGGS